MMSSILLRSSIPPNALITLVLASMFRARLAKEAAPPVLSLAIFLMADAPILTASERLSDPPLAADTFTAFATELLSVATAAVQRIL